MSVSLIYIRRSTPLTFVRLQKPVSEILFVTALVILASTMDGRVLTLMSANYVIKVVSSYCDTIAIGDISYYYEPIQSQLSTTRFVSPRASESALSYTHWVRNGLMITANDRTPNLSMFYWSQIYSILQLGCFALYWTESIPRHSGHMNRKSHLPQTKKLWSKQGLIHISPFGWQDSDISIIGYQPILYMPLHISRCHNGLILTTPHLPRTKPLERERVVVCSASRNKGSCR
jgi:hypothetical protein